MELAIAATVAGAATQAAGSIMAGREQSAAAQFEQQQLDIQSKTAMIAADQAEAKRREELTSNLETIQAIRAGRGVGANSPTGEAILTSATDDAESDIATERFNARQKADLSSRAAEMAGRKARTSLLAGYVGAGADILSGVGKAASIYAYPTTRARV
jgi:hypothetical protein